MIEPDIIETPETVGSHYNDLDVFYREIWGHHLHHGFWGNNRSSVPEATEALLEHLLSSSSLTARSKVCDIGCGYGATSRYIADVFGSKVTGMSVSKEQLEFARNMPHPNVDLILRDWMNNQLPREQFDLALSIESSEHMPDVERFFQESYRVLKPGGVLKVCVWLSRINPKPWEVRYLLKPICNEGRLRLCDQDEYAQIIKRCGFSYSKFEEVTLKVKKTWSICIRRCLWKFLTDSKYLRFMLKSPSENKKFLLSLFRIRAAYETGSMVYGIYTIRK